MQNKNSNSDALIVRIPSQKKITVQTESLGFQSLNEVSNTQHQVLNPLNTILKLTNQVLKP